MHIGIVVGEASGDILGAGLISAMREQDPGITVDGIAGPRMLAAGCQAIYPSERLAVMGLVEVLRRYRELRGIRESIKNHYITHPPDVFIGIDAPDFNLGLELALRAKGVPTVHYVSPSVWAWRSYRLRKIAAAVDLMLTLLPFEADYYRKHEVPVKFVGHPLADCLEPPDEAVVMEKRAALGALETGTLMALLPGSRCSEVQQLAEPFLETALWCLERRPGLRFIVPLASPEVRRLFLAVRDRLAPGLPLIVVDGQSQDVMRAADLVLLASGTATLEAMLLGKPMVTAYRMSRGSYCFARALLHIDHYTLPNLLAGEALIPEFIQSDVTAAGMGAALLRYLDAPDAVQALKARFASLGQGLSRNADQSAAQGVCDLLKYGRGQGGPCCGL